MLTSYMVSCPYLGCKWSGSLLPQGNREAWRGAQPVTPFVKFRCPTCRGEFDARVVGDDVEVLPIDRTPVPWA